MATRAPDFLSSAHPERSPWLQKLGRFGFAAKGVVYGLIGLFAAQAALGRGGQVGGGQETVRAVGQQPFGELLLVLIGVGLLGYALWRLIEAVLDTRHHGHSGRGLVKRLGYAGSGLMNGALAIVALQLAGGSSGRSSGEPDTFVGLLMQQPLGQGLVAAVGLGVIASGVFQIREGYTKRFMEEIDVSRLSAARRSWVVRSGMAGLIARGVVFAVIGFFLVKAALEHRPGSAVGVGGALQKIAAQPWGMVLLLIVAIGLVGYGLFHLLKAKYLRLPLQRRTA
jgi:hypothetical protein